MDCFFCGKKASIERSPLDDLGIPPDIHRAYCSTVDCLGWYDFIGTLMNASPNPPILDGLKNKIRKLQENGKAAILDLYNGEFIIWPPKEP